MIAFQRRLALIGRAELIASRWRVPWVLGAATLGMAKILENMEIGHNVMHGQWDWMNDPVINSRAWDWDTASTAEAWRHSHNFIHHTYTNIIGKDRDLGYEIMRIDPARSGIRSICCSRSTTSCWRSCSNGGSRSTTSTSTRSAPARRSPSRSARSSRGSPARPGPRSPRTTSPGR